MKLTIIVGLFILILSCGTTQTLAKAKDVKKEVEEGAVASKKIPTRIAGFVFNKKVNAYFRNDVSKTVQKRIVQTIIKGKRLGNKSGRLKAKASPKEFKDPYWSDYFGQKEINGTIDYIIRIGKNGKPDVIVIKNGIGEKANRIAAKYMSESLFNPGIKATNNKPVRSWLNLKKTYN